MSLHVASMIVGGVTGGIGGAGGDDMRQLPDSAIRAGRDRVSEVLEPLLGEDAAMERANNIVQALVFGARDPAKVATDMLRHAGLKDTPAVAARVDRAWREGIIRRPARVENDS